MEDNKQSNCNKKHEEDESIWTYYAKDTGGFIAVLIIISVIMGVAYFFMYISKGSHELYDNAEYKIEAKCTCISIEEKEGEKLVDDPLYKDKPKKERDEHKKVQEYTYYVFEWEYFVDDIRHTFTTTGNSRTTHDIGEVTEEKFYSNDGIEYKKVGFNEFTDLLAGLAKVVFYFCIYAAIRIVARRIKLAINHELGKKKRKI